MEMCRGKRKRCEEEPGDSNDDEDDDDKQDDKPWNQELHRCFVEAIYDAGVSQSSPSVIMENMSKHPASLTSERVKSHLQKYRKNKHKRAKDEFFQEYDSFLGKAMTVGQSDLSPSAMMELMGGGEFAGGSVAAFLTSAVLAEEGEKKATKSGKTTVSSMAIAKESQDYLNNFEGTEVPFPDLTPEELATPLGISLVHVMGLCSSLCQHIVTARRSGFKNKTAPFNPSEKSAFVAGATSLTAVAGGVPIETKTHTPLAPRNLKPAPASMQTQAVTQMFVQQQQAPQQQLQPPQQQRQHESRLWNPSSVPWSNLAPRPPAQAPLQEPQEPTMEVFAARQPLPPLPPRGFFHPIVPEAGGNVPLQAHDHRTVPPQTTAAPVSVFEANLTRAKPPPPRRPDLLPILPRGPR